MGEPVPANPPDASAEPVPLASTEPDPVSSALARIEEALGALGGAFEERLRYDSAKERAFDVLYAKLREQDGDQNFALKKNLILALLRLHDHIETTEAALETGTPGRQEMTGLRTQLLDILYTEDVEPITTTGEQFDRTRQHALGTVSTADPSRDSTVDRVVRQGFMYGSRILRPQSVVVRRYQTQETQELRKGA